MKWISLVLLAGLFAASPFLSSRGLGTSEAYNYSLSVADAVTQLRAGQFPVLVGQSEFAFNGRIHPLRTAPYMAHFAGALDFLTLRQLGFWTLQNLTLALSLIGGALACFWALRRTTPAEPGTAAMLSAVYILSPAVLAAAYGMDLYMTVMTVPFVPLIIAANVASLGGDRTKALLPLAVTLAACWLAHPPVALWMTVNTLLLQVIAAGRHRIGRREWPALAGAALVFFILAGFVFASVLAIAPVHDITRHNDVSGLLTEVGRNFAASLRPISPQADRLGDFQLGYAGWGLALAGLGLAAWRRHGTALSLLFTAALLFTLTAPVPGLNRWLWEHVPGTIFSLTSQWPMQRLYLPMTALVVFAFALVWQRPAVSSSLWRDGFRLLLVLGAGWILWQGWRFVGRGHATRQSQAAGAHSHLPENINLTVISYALLGAPGGFVNGVMDPAFEFRLLAPYDAHEAATNWSAPLPPAPENRTGELRVTPGDSGSGLDLVPAFTLEPGARYRLTLRFLVPPGAATLQVRGSSLFREYQLPAAGGPRGFGMEPGNNPGLTLWTTQAEPETIRLRLLGPGLADGPWHNRAFAGFAFERIDPAVLPVELKSLVPLQVRVRAPAAGYLETPRVFIEGYEARVNGRTVRSQRSPEGLLMLPVPAGPSDVEVRYPGPRLVRWSYWLACLGWIGVAVWAAGRASPTRVHEWTAQRSAAFRQQVRTTLTAVPKRRWLAAAGALLLLAGLALGWRLWVDHRRTAGPVRIRFVLPRGETNRQQPLLVTGQPNAGTFVYVQYADADHIRLGVDVWGKFHHETAPIKVDYFAAHEVLIDSGALYPPGHPALRRLPADALARLRNRFRLEFDGRLVFEREINAFDSAARDVTVGRNRIGGSTCEPAFAGEVLGIERLHPAAPSQ